MKFPKPMRQFACSLVAAPFLSFMPLGQAPSADAESGESVADTNAEPTSALRPIRSLKSKASPPSDTTGGDNQLLAAPTVTACQTSVPADSYTDNYAPLTFQFGSNPGSPVSFSVPSGCGSVDPVSTSPYLDDGVYKADTIYHPCENECAEVDVTAKGPFSSTLSQCVFLDERLHAGLCWELPASLGVSTYVIDDGVWEKAEVCTTVTVSPASAGSVTCDGYAPCGPNQWLSQFDSRFDEFVLFCDYSAGSASGRVRVRFAVDSKDVVFSLDQNTVLSPSSFWQTISDDLPACEESSIPNDSKIYKLNLSSSAGYDFSLCDGDGVGASADGDGDLLMCNSSCVCSPPHGWSIVRGRDGSSPVRPFGQ
jgi:hypothetical protein